ncbi:MAG: tail-specific protease [Desulfuromonas sp.]|nr:MAG: tail-specific protease [Desulfuromonas sp.]
MLIITKGRIGRWLLAVVLILAFFSSAVAKVADDFDANRARLLGHMIQQQLSQNHYSQTKLDDDFSQAAFDLYLTQLDSQKRFLVQADVKKLEEFKHFIDDAVRRGRLDLPELGRSLLNERIERIRLMSAAMLEQGFDLTLDEDLETDPEKADYPADEKEQKDLWRKILKYQVMVRYLNLYEDEIGRDENGALKPANEETLAALRQKAREKVNKNNDTLFDRMLEETRQDHYDRYLNAVTRAYDPHTNYLAPNLKEDFDIQMSGSLEGIGATLTEDDGYIKVVRVIPGSAAYRQGDLEADDIILQVAQGTDDPVDIVDTRLRDAVKLIRGKKGSEVRLTVKKPDSRQVVIPIVRDRVEIKETFVKGTTVKDPETDRTFGYIKIPSFYRDYNGGTGRNCTDDLRKELQRLKKADMAGLILDLRNNGGGALSDAVSITGLFIEQGPVVQVRDGSGRIRVLDDTDHSVEYDGPLVVLVNRFSASASEILAGALQDYRRALIVGDEHTHGKGTVQAMLDLDRKLNIRGMSKYRPLGAVKVTIQKFYRISGESTQELGVVPDIVLPSRMDGLKSGEKYLDNALSWDRIKPVDYQLWKEPLNLEMLKKHSEQRTGQAQDFVKIVERAERSQQRREETLQTLVLSEFSSEREETLMLDKDDILSSPHGTMSPPAADETDAGESESKVKKKSEKAVPTLDETISEDPYVDESVALLREMVAADG